MGALRLLRPAPPHWGRCESVSGLWSTPLCFIYHPNVGSPPYFTRFTTIRRSRSGGLATVAPAAEEPPAPHRERLREPALRRLGNLPPQGANPGRAMAREDVSDHQETPMASAASPFLERLRSGPPIVADGGMGTLVSDVVPNLRCPEEANIRAPESVVSLHLSFIRAGAELIETNASGANRRKLGWLYLEDEFVRINEAGA